MKIGSRKIYWDTTCWLAWLNDERCWPPDVLIGIQQVVIAVEQKNAILFTSAVTKGEIFPGRLNVDQADKYAKLMRRRNVQALSADTRIMERAALIREYHETNEPKQT